MIKKKYPTQEDKKTWEEYIKNPTLSNLTFEVLQRSGVNPMIQVNENNKIIEM